MGDCLQPARTVAGVSLEHVREATGKVPIRVVEVLACSLCQLLRDRDACFELGRAATGVPALSDDAAFPLAPDKLGH